MQKIWNWYLYVLKNFKDFKTRASREEFWSFTLVNIIIMILLTIIDINIGTFDPQSGVGMLSFLYSLFVLIPSLAVGARRLHDINMSGWWQLLGIIPFGGIVLLILWALPSKDEGNKYPKKY